VHSRRARYLYSSLDPSLYSTPKLFFFQSISSTLSIFYLHTPLWRPGKTTSTWRLPSTSIPESHMSVSNHIPSRPSAPFNILCEDKLPNVVRQKLEADIQQSQSIAIVVRSLTTPPQPPFIFSLFLFNSDRNQLTNLGPARSHSSPRLSPPSRPSWGA